MARPMGVFHLDAAVLDDGQPGSSGRRRGRLVNKPELEPQRPCADGYGVGGNLRQLLDPAKYIDEIGYLR